MKMSTPFFLASVLRCLDLVWRRFYARAARHLLLQFYFICWPDYSLKGWNKLGFKSTSEGLFAGC